MVDYHELYLRVHPHGGGGVFLLPAIWQPFLSGKFNGEGILDGTSHDNAAVNNELHSTCRTVREITRYIHGCGPIFVSIVLVVVLGVVVQK